MKLILACDPNGGIGYQNKLPWTKIQGDLPRFKQLTTSQVVIMGRNTWESLQRKPLPNRLNVIVTSNVYTDLPRGTITVTNLNELSQYAFGYSWLIGGATLVNSNWGKINEVHLTRTIETYTCDAFVDLTELGKFNLIHSDSEPDHIYEIWKRF